MPGSVNSEFQNIEIWFTDQNSPTVRNRKQNGFNFSDLMKIIKMRYSIEPRDRMCGKGYGFLSFAENMGKNVSNKYGQKLLGSAKKSTTDAVKTASERAIEKTAEATGDIIGNKIADKITNTSKKSLSYLKNDDAYSKMETLKKRYISPEERQQTIDELRLV